MFERCTDRFRQVVFAARAAASELGSPRIGAEHLLLGFLGQDDGFFDPQTASALKQKLEAAVPSGADIPVSVDMALNEEAQRTLATMGDAAANFGHWQIDMLHFLWALVKHPETGTGKILTDAGVTLEGVEQAMREKGYR